MLINKIKQNRMSIYYNASIISSIIPFFFENRVWISMIQPSYSFTISPSTSKQQLFNYTLRTDHNPCKLRSPHPLIFSRYTESAKHAEHVF